MPFHRDIGLLVKLASLKIGTAQAEVSTSPKMAVKAAYLPLRASMIMTAKTVASAIRSVTRPGNIDMLSDGSKAFFLLSRNVC